MRSHSVTMQMLSLSSLFNDFLLGNNLRWLCHFIKCIPAFAVWWLLYLFPKDLSSRFNDFLDNNIYNCNQNSSDKFGSSWPDDLSRFVARHKCALVLLVMLSYIMLIEANNHGGCSLPIGPIHKFSTKTRIIHHCR